ncbi:MAG: VCBS repeat-containing protein [Planctomycetota bacterium]
MGLRWTKWTWVAATALLGASQREAQCIDPLAYELSSFASGGSISRAVASADFDGDATPDLVIANQGSLAFAKGLGGGSFASAAVAGTADLLGLFAADMDGDGDRDVVGPAQGAAFVPSGITLAVGDGTGSFPALFSVGTGWGQVTSIAVADYDGDGLADVAASDSALGVVRTLLNSAGWAGETLPFAGGVGPLSAADTDMDGAVDLVLAGGGDLWVLANEGGPWTVSQAASGAGELALDTGDLDLDGFVDAVASGPGGQISVFAGQTATAFTHAGDLDWPFAALVASLRLDDVEQDGDLDLVALDLTRVGFFENEPGSGLVGPQDFEVPLSGSLTVADLNADGRTDVATTSTFFASAVNLLLSAAPSASPLFAEPDQVVPGAPTGQAFAAGLIATDDQLGFHYSVESGDGSNGATAQTFYVLADGTGLGGGVAGELTPTASALVPDPDERGATPGATGTLLTPSGCTGTSPDHFVGTVFRKAAADTDYNYIGLFVRPNQEPCCGKATEATYTVPRTGSATTGLVRRFAIGSQRVDCGGSEQMIVHFVTLFDDAGVERLEWVRGFVQSDDTVLFDPPEKISKGTAVDGFRFTVSDGGAGIVWAEDGELYVRTSTCGEIWNEVAPDAGETFLDYDLGIEGNTVQLVVVHELAGAEPVVESRFSTDAGLTFSPAQQLSDAPAGTNVEALELMMTAGGTGAVAVWEDDRFGAGGVFTAAVNTPGGSWTAERYLGCGESPGLVAGAGAVEQVAAFWTTNAGPRDLMASLSLDGGSSWDTPIAIDSGNADVVEPVAAYEELYDRFAFAWLADDGTGDLAPHFGGFRSQTLVPQGWQAGASNVSFDVANFLDPACGQAWVVLSSSPGSLPLPDGRDVLIAGDPTFALSLGLFIAALDAAGAGLTGSFALVLPPGLSLYAVAAGLDVGSGLVCDISGVVEIEL